jgi:hypothetical protein
MATERRSPTDQIPGTEKCLVDFWAWAYSDLLSNATRGVLAEFLVGVALGVVEQPRIEWDHVDLRYRGKLVEVKSSAFLQTWNIQHTDTPPTRLSKPSFDVGEKLGWSSETNTGTTTPNRAADCYVFCLYAEEDPSRANPLAVDAWEFYVLPTIEINTRLQSTKRIGIKPLRRLTAKCSHAELRRNVDAALQLSSSVSTG